LLIYRRKTINRKEQIIIRICVKNSVCLGLVSFKGANGGQRLGQVRVYCAKGVIEG
jgi:hypothetical protein